MNQIETTDKENGIDENESSTVPAQGYPNHQRDMKASNLVIVAIHHLKEAKGSTPKEIMDFIAQEYYRNTNQLKNVISTALKRGVQHGILKLNNGHYMLEPINIDSNLIMEAGCMKRRRRSRSRRCRSRSRKRRSRSRRRRSRHDKKSKKQVQRSTRRRKPCPCVGKKSRRCPDKDEEIPQ